MNTHRLLLLFLCIASISSAQRNSDFHLRARPDEFRSYPVFSQEDLTQLAGQKATLDQIGIRLGSIDENVKDVKKTLDNDVMPTIHVFNFLKWVFALIVAAVIGVLVNERMRRPATQS
jgi:hypothetical protein